MAMKEQDRCPECWGSGSYWTEWSDLGARLAEAGKIQVIYQPDPPDGVALIACTTCRGKGSGRSQERGTDGRGEAA